MERVKDGDPSGAQYSSAVGYLQSSSEVHRILSFIMPVPVLEFRQNKLIGVSQFENGWTEFELDVRKFKYKNHDSKPIKTRTVISPIIKPFFISKQY